MKNNDDIKKLDNELFITNGVSKMKERLETISQSMFKEFMFTVLIPDGLRDSSDDIIYWDRPTKIMFSEKPIKAILNNKNITIGKVKLERVDRFVLAAKFTEFDLLHIEEFLPALTPSISGKIHFKEGNVLKFIEIESISFDFGANADSRIKKLSDQFKEWDNKRNQKSMGDCCGESVERKSNVTERFH